MRDNFRKYKKSQEKSKDWLQFNYFSHVIDLVLPDFSLSAKNRQTYSQPPMSISYQGHICCTHAEIKWHAQFIHVEIAISNPHYLYCFISLSIICYQRRSNFFLDIFWIRHVSDIRGINSCFSYYFVRCAFLALVKYCLGECVGI